MRETQVASRRMSSHRAASGGALWTTRRPRSQWAGGGGLLLHGSVRRRPGRSGAGPTIRCRGGSGQRAEADCSATARARRRLHHHEVPPGPQVDRDYQTLRIDLQTLFHDLGLTTTHLSLDNNLSIPFLPASRRTSAGAADDNRS